MANYGRPMKGKSRRVPITIHSSVGLLDIIDELVEKRDQEEAGAYSRSDFFNEAALTYLRQLGYDLDDEEIRSKRTGTVPEKNGDTDRRKNEENTDRENRLK